ncbi:MAG: hypothetical protein MAG581_00749 [Deltaproteobacteria bacterium]|jgi:hypothetical protein|nr:hypothetical protein [Deltaproteobacteria bacterium]
MFGGILISELIYADWFPEGVVETDYRTEVFQCLGMLVYYGMILNFGKIWKRMG